MEIDSLAHMVVIRCYMLLQMCNTKSGFLRHFGVVFVAVRRAVKEQASWTQCGPSYASEEPEVAHPALAGGGDLAGDEAA
jgi:hypothetical protein